jgi:hypothetical protein
VYIDNGFSDWHFTNCTLVSNQSCEPVRRLSQLACTSGETASEVLDAAIPTGGIDLDGTGRMVNCISWGNSRRETTYGLAFGGSWELTCNEHATLSDQRAQVRERTDREVAIAQCCIQGSLFPGSGNINQDPMLVSQTSGTLTLMPGSPCIDRGLNAADVDPGLPGDQALPPVDLLGNPRIVDGDLNGSIVVDMGAFEFQP